MQPRLKNRQLQVPMGYTFYLPQIKWRAKQGSSFDRVVQELQKVIKANPALAKQHGWSTDTKWVEDWVDLYNATVCARNGWTNYIQEEGGEPTAVPKGVGAESLDALRRAAAEAKTLIAGAKALKEWDSSGDPAVAPELSLTRAQACASCPHNTEGDYTKWFTVPASELIRKRVEAAQARNLTTPLDDKLQICDVCYCPLKLKVHVPINYVVGKLPLQVLQKLQQVDNCWVRREAKELGK